MPASDQPREGALGLFFVAILTAVLLLVWDGPEATSHVLGILAIYALPVAAVIALWWEDWPGAALRRRWAGLVDAVLVTVAGTLLALLAQAIVQRPDLAGLFEADAAPPHVSAFPALLPLGVSVFAVFLEITLVTEGWPLRAMGRLGGGAAALGLSWVIGLVLERGLVGTHAIAPGTFTAVLSCVSAVQVLGWVVLRGSMLANVRSRAVRLAAGNVGTVLTGFLAFLVLRPLAREESAVGAFAAAAIGAGLVVGMLFEGWPTRTLGSRSGAVAAVLLTFALGAAGVWVCTVLARMMGVPSAETAGWSTYALNTVATAVILHVGIFRRWPLPPVPPV